MLAWQHRCQGDCSMHAVLANTMTVTTALVEHQTMLQMLKQWLS